MCLCRFRKLGEFIKAGWGGGGGRKQTRTSPSFCHNQIKPLVLVEEFKGKTEGKAGKGNFREGGWGREIKRECEQTR